MNFIPFNRMAFMSTLIQTASKNLNYYIQTSFLNFPKYILKFPIF